MLGVVYGTKAGLVCSGRFEGRATPCEELPGPFEVLQQPLHLLAQRLVGSAGLGEVTLAGSALQFEGRSEDGFQFVRCPAHTRFLMGASLLHASRAGKPAQIFSKIILARRPSPTRAEAATD